jgi:VanZ family protein
VTRTFWWLVSGAVAIAIFVASSIPGNRFTLPTFELADKVLHAIAYAGLGGALGLALATPARSPRRIAVLAAAIATGYGVTDELHQLITPFRTSTVSDAVADLIGAVIGATVAAALVYRRRRDARP